MFLKNLFVFILLLISAIPSFASSDTQEKQSYLARESEYGKWKTDLRSLASMSNEPLLRDVVSFLSRGAAIALPSGDGTVGVPHAKTTDVVTVLVLFPEDKNLGENWRKTYEDSQAAANFLPEMNLLILRAENMAPKVRGMLLGHEGMHALAFSAERKLKQTDQEYCNEEAIAHRLEYEVFRGIKPRFEQLLESEAKKVASGMRANNGRIKASINIDDTAIESLFGKAESAMDSDYRAIIFINSVIIKTLLKYYGGNEGAVMERFSSYLCGVYATHGIR